MAIAIHSMKYSRAESRTNLIKCDFGGSEHLLKFNGNYSRFISIRKDDFEVVVGNHL